MRELYKAHRFALQNLKSDDETIFQFYQDPDLHDGIGFSGPSLQEVYRMCIARLEGLDQEKPWPRNSVAIALTRQVIAELEMRALYYKVAKGELLIDRLPIGQDGHIIWQRP